MRIENKYGSDRLELYFDRKPSDEVLNVLNSSSWKWDLKKGCWYNKNTRYNALLKSFVMYNPVFLKKDTPISFKQFDGLMTADG